MTISVVFDPPLPSDNPADFNTKAFALLGDLNTWSTQANALPGEVATNLSALLAAPPAIGSTTPAAGSFTTLSASGVTTLSGGTIVNNGSGIVNPGAFQGSMFHHANYLQFAGGTTGTAFNNHANTVANLTIADTGAVTIPGTLSTSSIAISRAYPELTINDTNATVTTGGKVRLAGNGGGGYNYQINTAAAGDFTSVITALTIAATGAVTIPGSLSITGTSLGFGTGAGGTVTQATSKSTAVTLNKACGQITMNNAALGAGVSVKFVCINSTVTNKDTVIVCGSAAGPDPYEYSFETYATYAGSFGVRVTNKSAGSLSDALVVQFNVIKGATS
jgi:hypothetical protein